MTVAPAGLVWVRVTSEWAEASYQLTRAARNDCERSSASREAFGQHLTRIHDALSAMAGSRDAGEGKDVVPVSAEYRAAVNALADATRLDSQVSTASIETYSHFLRRRDAAISDVIASEPLAEALMSGLVSESALRAVLQRAVEGPAPLKLDFKVDGDPEDKTWSAQTPIGIYEIVEYPRGCLVTLYTSSARNVGRRIRDRVGVSREQAVAAAQSDFDTLVRGCVAWPKPLDEFTPTPQPASASRRAKP